METENKIKINRVDPETIDLFVNPELIAERLRIFKKISQNHITNLIGIQRPEIYKDFPDDFPPELEYSNYRSKDQPTSSKKTLESTLKEDVKDFIGDREIQKQRRSRYKGHYKVDEMQTQIFKHQPAERKVSRRLLSTSSVGSKSSVSSKGSLIKNSKTFTKAKIVETIAISSSDSGSSESDSDSSDDEVPRSTSSLSGIAQASSYDVQPSQQAFKKVKNLTRTLSSSSESEVEEAPKLALSFLEPQKQVAFETPLTNVINTSSANHEAPKKRQRILSLSSSDEDDNNNKIKVAKVTFKTPEAPASVLPNKSKTVLELTKDEEKHQHDKSNHKAAKNFMVPPVIEPPMIHPRTKKPITKESASKKFKAIEAQKNAGHAPGLEHLGGIFTVKNGWDIAGESFVDKFISVRIPKLKQTDKPMEVSQSCTTPVKMLEECDIEEEFEKQLQIAEDFDFSTNDHSDTENEEIVPSELFEAKSVFSDSEDEESNEVESSDRKRNAEESAQDSSSSDPRPSKLQKLGDRQVENVMRPGSNSLPKVQETEIACVTPVSQPEQNPKQATIQLDKVTSTAKSVAEKSGTTNGESYKMEVGKSSKDSDQESEKSDKDSEKGDESSSSSDEEEASDEDKTPQSIARDSEDDDRISLTADLDDLDDADYLPPGAKPKRPEKVDDPPEDGTVYTTALDDLKMILRKEVTDVPAEDAKAAFDQNTQMILGAAPRLFDKTTDRVIDFFFKGICLDWLENRCVISQCKLKHALPDVKEIRNLLAEASVKDSDDAYGFCLKYPSVLEKYFQLFAELRVKISRDYETSIGRMVLDCERTPRTHSWYKNIVAALETIMPKYKAIRFIISHHTDSAYAQDTIMQMIMETGPDLVRFLPYLKDISTKRSLSLPMIDKILEAVTTYQDPMLPMFGLDLVLTLNEKSLRQVNKNSLEQFLKFHSALSDFLDDPNRVGKLLALGQKCCFK